MTSPSATQHRYRDRCEPIWSRSEKAIARKAFGAALKWDLHEVMQETKQMASRGTWNIYLTERRKDIDRKYDTRGSRVRDVLGRLLYEKRLSEEDLSGLSEDKLRPTRSFAKFLAEEVAL